VADRVNLFDLFRIVEDIPPKEHPPMKRTGIVVLAGLFVIALSAGVWGGDMAKKPSGETSSLVESTATVETLDYKSRMATLRGADGSTLTFRVSDAVKNLEKVHVGDKVKFQYYESVAWEVKKAGEATPGVMKSEGVKRSGAEHLPAKLEATQTTVTTTIEAIDKQKQTVTLKGPEGNSVVVKARHPENLEKVQVGDKVVITYTEALAVSVEKVAAK
jgi:Cu/Ag efflux protein CusF